MTGCTAMIRLHIMLVMTSCTLDMGLVFLIGIVIGPIGAACHIGVADVYMLTMEYF